MTRQQRMGGRRGNRNTPQVVALDAVLGVIKRCGTGLINDYFNADAWRPYGTVVGHRMTLAEQRADRVKRLEADAAAKRLAAGQRSQAMAYLGGGRSRIRTLSSAQLRELARRRQEAAARLRAVPAEDLAVVQATLDIFIRREGGRHALATLASVDFFVVWLKKSSIRCEHCERLFVPLGSFLGGHPRSWCSNACKQSAWRNRRNAG
jgi:hypothetical protein